MRFARAGLFILHLGLLAQATVTLHEGRRNNTGKILPGAATSAFSCPGFNICLVNFLERISTVFIGN
jgi:hypothetical protein